jgi:hypothetical protein
LWRGRKGGREGKGGPDEKMEGNRNGCRDGGRKGMSLCEILNAQLLSEDRRNIGIVFVLQVMRVVKETTGESTYRDRFVLTKQAYQ